MKLRSAICALMLIGIAKVGAALEFRNLDFDDLSETSAIGLVGWSKSWGDDAAIQIGVDRTGRYLGLVGKTEGSVSFIEQSSQFTPTNELRIVKFTGSISSEDVKGRGAGLNLAVYDSAGVLIFNRDMGYSSLNWVLGTTGWTRYATEAILPENAAKVNLGLILYGEGEARFDSLTFSVLPVGGRKPSDLARSYITAAADSIAMNSLVRDSIDINALKSLALQIAGPAESPSECHLAVLFMLNSLRKFGDHHSFLMTPEEVFKWQNSDEEASNIEFAKMNIFDSCGYIFVPPFHSGNPKSMVAYADSIQFAIKSLLAHDVKGFIVDLRMNTGGNMEPMITGLGPLFDDGKLGAVIDVNGRSESWSYRSGTYFWEDSAGMSVSTPVVLKRKLPIAVLTGQQTGSSGEFTAVSFIGNSHTRLYGEPTWGLTTGNGGFDLPDGARVMLASTIMADKAGKVYHGPVEPDVIIKNDFSGGYDPVLQAAIDWINSQ